MARDPRYVPGGPPLKIGERHRLLITLAAMGHSNEEIAQQLNLHPVRVSMLRNSPEIKMAIERLQQQMTQESLGTFMDKIVAEAEPTLERLKELRDQDDELPVALGAAKELWESVVPKRTRHEEDKTVRLIVEGGDLKLLAQAIAEDSDKDIEDAEVVASTPTMIKPVQPEELEE